MIPIKEQHVYLAYIREILTIAAIVAGGIWAVWKFDLLEQGAIAQLDKQKRQMELQSYHPVMRLEMELRSWHNPIRGWLLEVAATVTNAGKSADRLDLSGELLRIYPVVFDVQQELADDAAPSVDAPHQTDPWGSFELDFPRPHTQSHLLPGESRTFRWLQRVPMPGVYYVWFKVPLSEQGRTYWPTGKPAGELAWSTGRFIEVAAE